MDKKTNLADLERENECLRRQLAELDELPMRENGRAVSELKGLPNINTSVSKKIHSVPPGRGDHDYLDLYVLQKERERLVKEARWIKKRRLQVGKRVSNVDKEITEKAEKALQEMTILLNGVPASQPDKKPVEEKATGKKQKASKRYEYKEKEWNKFTVEY